LNVLKVTEEYTLNGRGMACEFYLKKLLCKKIKSPPSLGVHSPRCLHVPNTMLISARRFAGVFFLLPLAQLLGLSPHSRPHLKQSRTSEDHAPPARSHALPGTKLQPFGQQVLALSDPAVVTWSALFLLIFSCTILPACDLAWLLRSPQGSLAQEARSGADATGIPVTGCRPSSLGSLSALPLLPSGCEACPRHSSPPCSEACIQ
jgi:hypothetical protein